MVRKVKCSIASSWSASVATLAPGFACARIVGTERKSGRFALLDDDNGSAIDRPFKALDIAEIVHLNDLAAGRRHRA